MLVLSNEDVARVLTMQGCIGALEAVYADFAAGRALVATRVDNLAPNALPGAYYAFKHMGGTWPAKGVQALRINSDVITHPLVAGKLRRVKQPLAGGRWVGLVLLFSTETGALLAIVPDGVMQRIRVGAANGIALDRLARPDVSTLALIGSGWQAGAQLEAALAVRAFRDVRVYSTRRENREAFAAEATARHGSRARIAAVDSAEACVAGADVIMAATSSVMRVIEPAWLRRGMHVSCIKAQEVDGAVLDACDRVFVHTLEQAKQIDNVMKDTPNVVPERGWWNDGTCDFAAYPDLSRLIVSPAPARRSPEEITCFVNNVGSGLQFAAAGALVLEHAKQAGLGHELPDDWFSEDVHP